MEGLIHRIRRSYSDCTTRSLRENQCRLQLNADSPDSLVVIDGAKYQANKRFTGKLCDGILFWERQKLFVAAVELKGGRGIRLSDAIKQIQGGANGSQRDMKRPLRYGCPHSLPSTPHWSLNRGAPLVPACLLLVGVGHPQQETIFEGAACQLEADGQVFAIDGGKATGDRQGRDVG